MNENQVPIVLQPHLEPRVWGGSRLGTADPPIGESWIVSDRSLIVRGPHAGESLASAVESNGENLIGTVAWHRGERTFPLLIKLVDVAEWLSIQVHPNDNQVEMLEGHPGRGKTEAWYFIDAEPNAEIIAGVQPGTKHREFEQAVRSGTIEPLLLRHLVSRGDTVFIPAGTVHALGPGAFIYEIQQSSDITYRAFDWGRPASDGRALHLDQAIRVADPELEVAIDHHGCAQPDSEISTLAECEYFTLRRCRCGTKGIRLDTRFETFHALTAIEGNFRVVGDFESESVGELGSILIPASVGGYQIETDSSATLLIGSAV